MKKRIISALLVLVFCVQLIPLMVSAAPNYYTPGDMTYSVNFKEPVSLTGDAAIEGGNLSLPKGSSASFDILFRFDVETVKITYETKADQGNITMALTENSYDIPVTAETTEATASVIDRQGSQTVTFTADCDVIISSAVFTKKSVPISRLNDLVVNLNDYETALQTTVVVNPNKVTIKVDDAIRYVDYEDPSLTPMLLDGRMYLPIHTAARAFSLYYEDYSDLNYIYLMNESFELYSGEKGSYTIINGVQTQLGDFAVYKDGRTWVPVRQLAELMGLTVGYRDGFAIIDDRICVKNIIENDSIFTMLVKEFEEYDKTLVKQGDVYHVSQAAYASDSNNGSEQLPFRTIQKAAEVAREGDTVIIHEGTYRETVTPKHDGSATNPIIFKAAEGEKVTISAFEKVSGFSPYEGDVYQTLIPKSMGYDRNFVIQNDEILVEGRHPNSNTSTTYVGNPKYTREENPMHPTYGDIRIPEMEDMAYDYAISEVDLNQEEEDYWKGGTFITLTGSAWCMSYGQITGSEKGKIHLADYPNNTGYGIKYYKEKKENDYGYITHHLNTVDMPGEWYVDDETNVLYMIPPEGQSPETMEVEIKQRQLVIDLRDRSYVQFVDINTRGGGITMAGDTNMDVINGGSHYYISQFDWSCAASTHHTRFYDSESIWTGAEDAPEMGEAGLFAHGFNNAYMNMDIRYAASAGIYLTGTHSYIENNMVLHTSYMGTYPSGITIEGIKWDKKDAKYGGHTIINNTVRGGGRSNIYMSRNFSEKNTSSSILPVMANEVAYNNVSMGAASARDSGNVYMYGITLGNDWARTKLHHNVTCDIATSVINSFNSSNLYHDGFVDLVDTHSNIMMYTIDGYYTSQWTSLTTGDYINYIGDWGNKSLGLVPEGVTSLKPADFPYGKPFRVGSTLENNGRFMWNYDQYTLGVTRLANDAVLAGGAELTDRGYIEMPTEEATVTFPNVEFYESGSKFSLYYSSDVRKLTAKTIPNVKIELLKDGEVVSTMYQQAMMHAEHLTTPSDMNVLLKGENAGVYDVRISMDRDFVQLWKLMVTECNYEEEAAKLVFPADGTILLLGTWDECVCSANCAGPRTQLNPTTKNVDDRVFCSIHDTAEHKMYYKDRNIAKDATKMTMRLGSSARSGNVNIYVYADSLEGEPIASFDVQDYILPTSSGWLTENITVDLNGVLPAGNHDIYVVYEGHESRTPGVTNPYGATDSYYISFHN